MAPRPDSRRRFQLVLEGLEERIALTGNLHVPLDPTLDQFGDQIITVQGYETVSRTAFSIFDTGASALTFGAEDQSFFQDSIPIKVVGGAVAEGIGGTITGDVSQPGIMIADGLHAADLTFDEDGFPLFDIHFGPDTAMTPGIQAFLGTDDGSPILPTITGTPILSEAPGHPNGLGVLVDMQGVAYDFGDVIPGLILYLPDLHFVEPNTVLAGTELTTDPVQVQVQLFGGDNHHDPGDLITETPSPVVPGVGLTEQTHSLGGQTFLFDTGAQLSIISTAEAEALGFDLDNPETTITVQGAAGTVDVPGYTLDELTVPTADGGTIQFTDVPVYVLDIADGIDGIWGMNMLNTASKFLYDPHATGGPVLSMTFFLTRDPGDGGDGEFGEFLKGLGIGFGNSLQGNGVPRFEMPSGQIDGRLYRDGNADAVLNAGESGLAGRVVFLDSNNDGRLGAGEPAATTDAAGNYHFGDLTAGSYHVRTVNPTNWLQTTPGADVTLGAGQHASGQNIGAITRDGLFVAHLYRDLLGRPVDQRGQDRWTGDLARGVSRDQAARNIMAGDEYRTKVVRDQYQLLLNRPADARGLASNLDLLRRGWTVEQVRARILGSLEYFNLAGGTDTAFIRRLYGDVLGRDADARGLASWTAALGRHVSRESVAAQVMETPEGRQQRVRGFYRQFLNRQADAGGLASFVASLNRGNRDEVVIAALLASPEYYLRS